MRLSTLAAFFAALGLAACDQSAEPPSATAGAPSPVTVPDQGGMGTTGGPPPFTFRGLTAGTSTLDKAKELNLVEECDPGSGEDRVDTYCDWVGYRVADVNALDDFVIFDDGIFMGMIVEIRTDDFETAARNLTSAYGEPCGQSSAALQNGFGAQFSGDKVEWCFDIGILSLERHMPNDFTHGQIQFARYAPNEPAKTYTPDSL